MSQSSVVIILLSNPQKQTAKARKSVVFKEMQIYNMVFIRLLRTLLEWRNICSQCCILPVI